MKTITNYVPRFTIDPHELTEAERKDFDYLDWEAIDDGRESATFFRYRGRLYDLGEFQLADGLTDERGYGWDGHHADSFSSAIVVRVLDDGERVVVGLMLAE